MDGKGESLALSLPGLFVLLTVLGVAYLKQPPLRTTRPPAPELADISYTDQQVPARLWQDPFAAVEQYLADRPSEAVAGEPLEAHELEGCERLPSQDYLVLARDSSGFAAAGRSGSRAAYPGRCPLPSQVSARLKSLEASTHGSARPKLLVMAVMLPGDRYAEQTEQRIRRRYAVLSGLHAAGYMPDDPSHIGSYDAQDRQRFPLAIPYEWLSAGPGATGANASPPAVLVLWLNHLAFRSEPLATLRGLVQALAPAEMLDALDASIDVKLIGPQTSDGLVALLEEATRHQPEQRCTGTDGPSGQKRYIYTLISPSATAEEGELFAQAGSATHARVAQQHSNPRSLSDYLSEALPVRANESVRFHRTIADDRQLSALLVDELVVRGLAAKPEGLLLDSIRKTNAWLHRIRAALTQRAVGGSTHQEPMEKPSAGAAEQCSFRDHVVLISEWDTAYGRSLPVSVSRALVESVNHVTQQRCQAAGSTCPQGRRFASAPSALADLNDHPWIHALSYVRGLDGAIASTPKADSKQNGRVKAVRPDDTAEETERAQGTYQLDYARRLAADLRRLNEELRSCSPRAKIFAIGILGSDVHDKLLILQALRRALPTAVFFTTDLDARLLDRSELEWTRGLIVASAFGLTVSCDDGFAAASRRFQWPILPFRGVYQTAYFYAVRSVLMGPGGGGCAPPLGADLPAVGDNASGAEPGHVEFANGLDHDDGVAQPILFRQTQPTGGGVLGASAVEHQLYAPQPELYEVGRQGAVSLRVAEDPMADVSAPAGINEMTLFDVWFGVALFATIFALMVPVLYRGQALLGFCRRIRQHAILRPLAAIALVLAGLAFVVWLWPFVRLLSCPWGFAGEACLEPLSLTNGISTWPGIYLQTLALVLALVFTALVMWRVRRNKQGMWRRFFGGMPDSVRPRAPDGRDELASFWARTRNRIRAEVQAYRRAALKKWQSCAYSVPRHTASSRAGDRSRYRGVPTRAAQLWQGYVRDASALRRGGRVLITALLFFFLIVTLYFATGGGASNPVRGVAISHLYLDVRLLSLFFAAVLAFSVLDVTLKCRSFVRELADRSVAGSLVWPRVVVAAFAREEGMAGRQLKAWIALRLIAEHTDLVARLALLPLIVLLILVVARLPWFDTITLPVSVLVAYVMLGLYIFYAAWTLQRAADRAKTQIKAHYEHRLNVERGRPRPDASALARLEILVKKVDGLREGAFQPLSQKPLVRIAVLPFGALGITLIELLG